MWEKAQIWIIHAERKVLLTNEPGVPESVCGFVSDAARAAAQARGYATVSEIGFPIDVHIGGFDCPEGGGWGEAREIAEAKARELGYELECYAMEFDYSDDELEDSEIPDFVFQEDYE